LEVRLNGGAVLLAANFGQREARLALDGAGWQIALDTNDGRYGGAGKRAARVDGAGLVLDSASAVLLVCDQ
jgi:hypothetical protein